MPTQVSLLDGALASAGTLAIQTNGTTNAITISSAQVATFVNNPIMTGLTASRAVFTDGSKGLTSNAITGTGNVVMSASPTLTGTVAGASLQLSSLTSGRVTYAGSSGLLQDSANLLYSGTDLTVYGLTVGRGAGAVSTNTAVGASALAANTTGTNNTGVGNNALLSNTTGNRNSSVGRSALGSVTTASDNSALGYFALQSNSTGAANTAVGVSALQENTTANNNTAVGYQAGYSGTTAASNVYIGRQAGYTTTTGSENTAVGDVAFYLNTTGGSNVALGRQALYSNTTGSNHTAVGYQALYNNTGGAQGSTALGYTAGSNLTSGTNGVFIGSNAQPNAATDTNELVIGTPNTTGKGSNTGFIVAYNGSTYGGIYQGNNSASWSTTSDQRLKKNIVDNNDGLAKINAIRVRNFEYRLPEEVDAELKPIDAVKKSGVQLGVIAQELQQVLPDCVKQESTGVLSVDPDNLTWYLVNAVKQLSAKVEALESQLNKGA